MAIVGAAMLCGLMLTATQAWGGPAETSDYIEGKLSGIASDDNVREQSRMVLVSAITFEDVETKAARDQMDIALSMDAFSQAISPDTKVTPGFSLGVDYQYPVQVGNIPGLIMVRNSTLGSFAEMGERDIQFVYIHRQDDTTITTAAGEQTIHRDSSMFKFKYAPTGLALPLKGRLGLGGTMYTEEGRMFAQPYAMYSIQRAAATLGVGASRLSGDIPHQSGWIASASYVMSPRAITFMSYSSEDFQKALINNYVLGRAGIDCATCSQDALSAGATMRFGGRQGATLSLGVYDISDLKIFFGNLSLNRRF